MRDAERRTRAGRRRWAAAILVGGASLAVAPAATAATTKTFTQRGESTFTVPAGVTTLSVSAQGGQGGNGNGTSGGEGRQISADLPVTPGEVLYIDVAGNGANGRNGGGGGGGGASAVRTCSQSATSCPGGVAPLQTRLLIAGGGGGGGGTSAGGNGGDADQPGWDGLATSGSGGDAGTTYAGGDGGTSDAGSGSAGSIDSGGAGGAGRGSGGGAGGANGGGAGGAGSDGGGGGGAGYNGGGGGAPGDNNPNFDPFSGGGGGGASWVVSTAANVTETWSSNSPSITLTYTPTPGPTILPPIVATISPNSGPLAGGQTVTITGSYFAQTRSVLFGATAAPRFQVTGFSTLTAVVPPAQAAATVGVRVNGPGGLSAVSPATYTYTATPPPTPPPPPAAPTCQAPNLIGASLARAQQELQQADCTLGTVTRPRRGLRVRVYRQSVGAGTHLVAGVPVNVWLRATHQRRG